MDIDPVKLHLLGRDRPFKRMYIGGTFDCLHRGHVELFRNAASVAEKVIVGLNTDEFATRYKRKPLVPFADRLAVLWEMKLLDSVCTNTGDEDSKPAILFARADAIGHGDDWVGQSLKLQMGLTDEWLTKHGVAMVYLPYTHGVSTSELRGLTSGQGAG